VGSGRPNSVQETIKFLGSVSPQRTFTLYEYSGRQTNTSKKAEFREREVGFTFSDKPVNKSVLIVDNCTYVSALNKKNALKKIGV
jgi:hypothetical protein